MTSASNPMTEQARAAVAQTLREGEPAPHLLRPGEHAGRLPSSAVALKKILESDAVAAQVALFKKHDKAAIDAQKRYLKLRKATIWSTFFTIVAAAFLGIFPPTSLGLRPIDEFYILMGFLGALLAYIVVLFYLGRGSTQQDWHIRWYSERAEAEKSRREFFEKILTDQDGGDGASTLPLKLEYFVLHQLEVQKAYLMWRSKVIANETNRWSRWGGFWSRISTEALFAPALVAAVLLAVAYSPIVEQGTTNWPFMDLLSRLSHKFSETMIAQAFLFGLIAVTALSAVVFSLSMANPTNRHARRFANTLMSMQRLEQAGLEAARSAAAEGDKAAVQSFVGTIHGLMAAEHDSWLVLTAPEAEQRVASVVQRDHHENAQPRDA